MGEAPASAKATANGDAVGEGGAAGASCAVGVALGDAGGVAAAAEEIAALEVGAAAGAGECEAVGSDSESDGDLDEECEEEVMLGFAERPRARAAMAAAYFPSKVGGEPAWLAPPTEGSVREREWASACWQRPSRGRRTLCLRDGGAHFSFRTAPVRTL